MYNMYIDVSMFGYKFKLNLAIVLIIFIVYLIIVSNTFCSCCYNKSELLEGYTNSDNKNAGKKQKKINGKEGFVGANTNYGQSSPYDLKNYTPVNTSKWSKPDLTVIPGQPLNPAVKEILNRPNQQLPLPEGELFLFANTPFKPECCPNTFSNGSGCACMNTNTYNYLIMRGGNNVPYSEY